MALPLKKHKVRTTYMFRNEPINQVCIYSEPVNGVKNINDSTSMVGQMYALCPADYQYSNKLASVDAYQKAKTNAVEQSDIECDYCPSYEISFGETICSFGLPYNDHNYAVPNGLTPPNTPPHLRDGFSDTFFLYDNVDTQKKINQQEDPEVAALSEKTSELINSFVETEDGVSRWERKLRAILKAQNLINGESHDETISHLPAEPEFGKVVEVPEELCVSPSHFNDIDSDTDEFVFDESNSKVPKRYNSGNPSQEDYMVNANSTYYPNNKFIQSSDIMTRAAAAGCSKIARKLPDNSTVNCFCNQSHSDGGMIQCILCFNWQHFDCVYYGEKLSNPYTCYVCLPRPRNPTRALQIQNLKLSGKPIPVKLYYHTPPQQSHDSTSADNHNSGHSLAKSITEKIIESHSNLSKAIPSPPRSSKRKQDFSCQSYMELEEYKKMEDDKKSSGSSVTVATEKGKRTPSKKLFGGVEKKSGRQKLTVSSSTTISSQQIPRNSQSSVSGDVQVLTIGSPIKLEMLSPDDSISIVSNDAIPPPDITIKEDELPASHAAPASARITTVASAEQDSDKAIIRYGVKRRRRRKMRDSIPDQSSNVEPNASSQSMHYEQILTNQCSELAQNILNEACASGKIYYYDTIPPFLMRSPLSRIVLFGPSERGLESSCSLCKGDNISEFIGCVMMLSEYESFSDIYHEYNRFLLCVNFDNKDVVVDAADVGNDTRFIRRSCKPNCSVNPVVVGSSIHFMIRATEIIVPGTELTLPFDVNYTMCRYNVECACSRSRCPVARWNKKVESKRAVPTLDYSKYIQSQLRVLSQPMSQTQSYTPATTLANSSSRASNSGGDNQQQYVVTNFTLDDLKEPPLNPNEESHPTEAPSPASNSKSSFQSIIRTRRQKKKS